MEAINGSTKAKIKIMDHFLKGGEIEFIMKDYPVDSWHPLNPALGEPSWDWVKYDYRIKKTSKFRLPTKEEFDNLIDHFSRWNKEKKGLEVENEHGEILFFSTAGYRFGTAGSIVGSGGYYWSSTMYEHRIRSAYYLYFDSSSKYTVSNDILSGRSVRLVSDIPFEGGIEFNGIWWKTENEPGYYSYEEAIEQFG